MDEELSRTQNVMEANPLNTPWHSSKRPRKFGSAAQHWLTTLFLFSFPFHNQAQEEQVLFFTARADQTGSANGGTAIWSFEQNTWRWWFQAVEQANVSPDGRSVVYIFQNTLHIADIAGQQPQAIRSNAASPVWSPQGDKIAYIAKAENALVIITPANERLATFEGVINWARPSWSPDGSQIAYEGPLVVDHIGCELFANGCPATQSLQTVFILNLSNGRRSHSFIPSHRSFAGDSWSQNGTMITSIITESIQIREPQWSPKGDRIAVRKQVARFYTYPDPASGIPDRWVDLDRSLGSIPVNGPGFTRFSAPKIPPRILTRCSTLVLEAGLQMEKAWPT